MHPPCALSLPAFTEVHETVGYGQTGPAEGLAGTNSVVLLQWWSCLERVTKAV
ncbi:MAG: hypothetical protein ICV75_06320 [Nitrospiraceae bacterium]|nr:hypothetical protein [Nitrospiraceae bacterium]